MIRTFDFIGSALNRQDRREELLAVLRSPEPCERVVMGYRLIVVPQLNLLVVGCEDERIRVKFIPATVGLKETVEWLEGLSDGTDWEKTIRWLR